MGPFTSSQRRVTTEAVQPPLTTRFPRNPSLIRFSTPVIRRLLSPSPLIGRPSRQASVGSLFERLLRSWRGLFSFASGGRRGPLGGWPPHCRFAPPPLGKGAALTASRSGKERRAGPIWGHTECIGYRPSAGSKSSGALGR